MADSFISYAQKDRERVSPLVDALTAAGYDVWWDLEIRAGESFDQLIEDTLKQVACVVSVWSRHSVRSEWGRAESAWAKDKAKLVSMRIDECELPLKFYHVYTLNMTTWSGAGDGAAFQELLAHVGKIAGPPSTVTRPVKARDETRTVARTPATHSGDNPPADTGADTGAGTKPNEANTEATPPAAASRTKSKGLTTQGRTIAVGLIAVTGSPSPSQSLRATQRRVQGPANSRAVSILPPLRTALLPLHPALPPQTRFRQCGSVITKCSSCRPVTSKWAASAALPVGMTNCRCTP